MTPFLKSRGLLVAVGGAVVLAVFAVAVAEEVVGTWCEMGSVIVDVVPDAVGSAHISSWFQVGSEEFVDVVFNGEAMSWVSLEMVLDDVIDGSLELEEGVHLLVNGVDVVL